MDREERVFKAPHGGRIYAQLAGPENGDPLFFHTGTPGSRYLLEEHVQLGADRGFRHICISRPGYGGSDRHEGRSLADGAAETALVADRLGVERFYVLGASSGGNYTLSCAALLPDRVISAAALAAGAPRAALGRSWKTGMGDENLEEFAALEEGPAALQRYIQRGQEALGRAQNGTQLAEAMEGSLCEADLAVMRGSFLEWQVESCRRLGLDEIWGWYDDDWAFWGPWGFDPTQIRVPVSIWSGGQDKFVPFAHGRWLAANIPGARAHLLEEEGHMSIWAKHYGAILDELRELGRK